jgi:hypothetical protein
MLVGRGNHNQMAYELNMSATAPTYSSATEEQSAQSLTGIIVRCCLTLGEQFYTDAIGG